MKAIKIKKVIQQPHPGVPAKLSNRKVKTVKESNSFFDWYKRSKAWKVVDEYEVGE